jgi:hypothetical protein
MTTPTRSTGLLCDIELSKHSFFTGEKKWKFVTIKMGALIFTGRIDARDLFDLVFEQQGLTLVGSINELPGVNSDTLGMDRWDPPNRTLYKDLKRSHNKETK